MQTISKLFRRAVAAGVTLAIFTFAGTSPASASEKVFHSFQGGDDGANPRGGLIADAAGNLYGTTEIGGTGTACYGGAGCGTIFEIGPDRTETILYSFKGGSDGIAPSGSLLLDSSSSIYGTTIGGAGTGCFGYGCGTVFKLAPDGTETVLYSFKGGSDGAFPEGDLIADKKGNLYGVTSNGGSYNVCSQDGCGTVFEVKPSGKKITLYTFQGTTDGAGPAGGLIRDKSGNLYGTTEAGGGTCDCGTVFKLAPDGMETVLYDFQDGSDGAYPEAGLIADKAGNFYGTTSFGGVCLDSDGCGTVFRLAPDGTETVLYSFQGSFDGGSDGEGPEAALVMDKAGNLYGTTSLGGGNKCKATGNLGCGTVFELAPDGIETVLYAFAKNHGANPAARLLLGKHGELYGTAPAGGKSNDGVVYEVMQ